MPPAGPTRWAAAVMSGRLASATRSARLMTPASTGRGIPLPMRVAAELSVPGSARPPAGRSVLHSVWAAPVPGVPSFVRSATVPCSPFGGGVSSAAAVTGGTCVGVAVR